MLKQEKPREIHFQLYFLQCFLFANWFMIGESRPDNYKLFSWVCWTYLWCLAQSGEPFFPIKPTYLTSRTLPHEWNHQQINGGRQLKAYLGCKLGEGIGGGQWWTALDNDGNGWAKQRQLVSWRRREGETKAGTMVFFFLFFSLLHINCFNNFKY